MFFDARQAKLLKPGAHLVVMGCSGLRLVANQSSKSWIYRYRERGTNKLKQTLLGHWPQMPAASAAAKWQELRDARSIGESPQELQQVERGGVVDVGGDTYTVRSLVNDYVSGQLYESRKTAGALAAHRSLDKFLMDFPELADKAVGQVTRTDCFDVVDANKGLPKAAEKLKSLLGLAWDYQIDAGRIEVPNWWRMVFKNKLQSKGKIIGGEHEGAMRRVLSQSEIATLMDWLHNMHSLGRDATIMYLWTCARGSEILSMKPEHIKREGKQWWWTVPIALTKNAKVKNAVDLRVPLFGRALEVVQRRVKKVGESGFLFEDVRGEQYTQHDFSTYIYNLQPYSSKTKERQGEGLMLPVTHWTPHNLRRTGRTALAALKCPQEVGEAIVGHMPTAIIATYNLHTYDDERVEWLGKLSAYMCSCSK